MGYTSERTRLALGLTLVAVVVTGCAGSSVARTREPITTDGPAAVAATTWPDDGMDTAATPSATPSPPPATPTPPTVTGPDPTPIADDGLPAPALDGLVTSTGKFDMAELRGAPTLVFFGYTHCPDVCPATIGELVELVDRRPDVHVVFVTVDPERDTPAFLGEWVKYLPHSFAGVTGSPMAIKSAADGWGVRYARVDSPSAAGYSMSHTAFVYLVDAQGQLRLHFPFGTGWKTMLQTLDTLTPAPSEVPS